MEYLMLYGKTFDKAKNSLAKLISETIIEKVPFYILVDLLTASESSRSNHRKCSVVFLEISQNSHENTCVRVSLLKKKLCHRCFHVNFVKFLRTSFLQNTFGRLLLKFFQLDVL